MKFYKKSDLTVISGMLVSISDNEVVFPDDAIIEQGNLLEDLYQKAMYLNAQPEAVEAPSLDGFRRVSVDDELPINEFTVVTPTIDRKYAEAMAFMDEVDEVEVITKANEMCRKFADLIRFADSDNVLAKGSGDKHFDMPTIVDGGDVLSLTADDIKQVIAYICGLEKVDENDGPKINHVTLQGEDADKFLNFINSLTDDDDAEGIEE